MALTYPDLARAAVDNNTDDSVPLRAAEQLLHQGKLPPARALLKRRLVIKPELGSYWRVLARLHTETGSLATGASLLRRAVAILAPDPAATVELVNCLDGMGRQAEADSLAEALRGGAVSSKIVTRTLVFRACRSADMIEAWRLRYETAREIGHTPTPAEFAERPHHYVVDCATLLGEALECIGFLAFLKPAPRLTIACAARLHRLVQRSFPTWTFIETPPDTAQVLTWEAVPWLVHQTTGAQPEEMGGIPYLRADGYRARSIRSTLRKRFPSEHLIGIGWRSRPRAAIGGKHPAISDEERIADFENDRTGHHHPLTSLWRKVLPFGNLSPIVFAEDTAAISLQHGVTEGERAYLKDDQGLKIHFTETDFGGDLDDIAALITALDGVFSVPGTHTHLSGALGIPTVVPLHQTPPHLSTWPMHKGLPLYPNLTVLEKRAATLPNGALQLQYMGDWRDMANQALDLIRASAKGESRR